MEEVLICVKDVKAMQAYKALVVDVVVLEEYMYMKTNSPEQAGFKPNFR